MPDALVTGAARGIGRAITAHLVDEGWHVYAGVRSLEAGEALQAEVGADCLTPVLLDVTNPVHIAALESALPDRLDALVNNAGIAESGPLEAMSAERIRHQLEVNVVGQIGVTSTVMPKLRLARGRVVFIGSVSGRVTTPMLGAYGASKFALEAVADAFRVELRPWTVHVVLIEPGSVDTAIWREARETVDQVEAEMTPAHRELYASQVKAMRRLTKLIQGNTTRPERVAATVGKALTVRRPRARYIVGADAYLQIAQRVFLPTRANDAVMALLTGARKQQR